MVRWSMQPKGRVPKTRRARHLKGCMKDEAGQMVPELVLVIPAFALALVLIVNVLSFVSECARFDRMVGEVARIAAADQREGRSAAQLLQEALGYEGGSKGPFHAQVQASLEGISGLRHLRLTFTLNYRVFASAAGTGGLGTWKRTKTVVVPYCQPLTEL